MELYASPQAIYNSVAEIRLDIMKHDGNPSASLLQQPNGSENTPRKTSPGPCQRRVLKHEPGIRVGRRTRPQVAECPSPAVFCPVHSGNFQGNALRHEGPA